MVVMSIQSQDDRTEWRLQQLEDSVRILMPLATQVAVQSSELSDARTDQQDMKGWISQVEHRVTARIEQLEARLTQDRRDLKLMFVPIAVALLGIASSVVFGVKVG